MKFNIVVIGDGAVGKDFLCLSYIGSKLPDTDSMHCPLLPEYEKIIEKSNGSEITLNIQTLPAIEGYERVRSEAYLKADCIILCFAIDSKPSFVNVESKWIKEIIMSPRKAPLVLVGTKRDLRTSTDDLKTLVSEAEAQKLADKYEISYIDCSAIWKLYICEVFDEVLNAISQSERATGKYDQKADRKVKTKSCVLC